jgi:glycosyltransferase involved in cell wall biosynthesis
MNTASRPLKVCHYITRLDLGGSAENTLLTAIGLQSRGYAVEIVCGMSDNPPSETEKKTRRLGIAVVRDKNLARPVSPLRDLRALLFLAKHLRRNRCDILHTHTSKAGIIGRTAGLLAGVKCIIHTPHGHIFYGYFSRQLTRAFVWLEWLATLWTDALITLTNQEKLDYLRKKIGSPRKIYPILSGIDLAPFLAPKHDRDGRRRAIGLAPSDFAVGTVARLVPVKNHDLIISAAALLAGQCPGLKFVFTGDGGLRPALEARIRSLGLADRFIFTGWRNDIAECLYLFDLFVMCSHNEGMGRAFVEAQASGLPVLGSRVGGVEEVMDEGKTGFIIEPGNAGQLAEYIVRLYRDRPLRERMAAESRAFVTPRFSADAMVEKIDAVYRQALAAGNAGRAAITGKKVY